MASSECTDALCAISLSLSLSIYIYVYTAVFGLHMSLRCEHSLYNYIRYIWFRFLRCVFIRFILWLELGFTYWLDVGFSFDIHIWNMCTGCWPSQCVYIYVYIYTDMFSKVVGIGTPSCPGAWEFYWRQWRHARYVCVSPNRKGNEARARAKRARMFLVCVYIYIYIYVHTYVYGRTTEAHWGIRLRLITDNAFPVADPADRCEKVCIWVFWYVCRVLVGYVW